MIPPWGTARCATAAFLVLWLITAQLGALDFTCTTNNGAITITGYTGPGAVVILPSSINGLPVTSIGEGAFSHCTNLTHLKIPNSVTNVGRGAFQGYSGPIGVYKPQTIGSQMAAESGTNLWTERVMLPLANGLWGCSTQVLYEHQGNPSGPWPGGNRLFFRANPAELEGRRAGWADVVHWRISNCTAENFFEITRRLGLTSVEAEVVHNGLFPEIQTSSQRTTVQMVDAGVCTITDSRIPKEWLR